MAMQRQGWGGADGSHGRAPIPADSVAQMSGRRQSATAFAPSGQQPEREYAFLLGTLIDPETLARAAAEAALCGVATHDVLMARGTVSQLDYAVALARRLDVAIVSWDAQIEITGIAQQSATDTGLSASVGGQFCRLLAATDAPPAILALQVTALRQRGVNVALAPQFLINAALETQRQPERIGRAVLGLLREQPSNSARTPASTWQMVAGAMAAGLLIGGFAVLPDATLLALTALIAVPFLCVTALRLVALRQVVARSTQNKRAPKDTRRHRVADDALPVYTVLVPVFREANVLPGLIQSLRALDYPPAKLEIFLILEAVDTETQAAVLRLALPGNFRSLVVPEGGPQTKPKALNYALQFARGDFVVVYDAEDRPQPGQLRRAWEVFRRSPPNLACLQAQLNIYNPHQSFSPANLQSNIPCSSTPSCPRSRRCACRCRLGEHRTTFRERCSLNWALGTPTTSPKTPISAYASPGLGTRRECWLLRHGKRLRPSFAYG